MKKKLIFYAHSSQGWDSCFPILVELLRRDKAIDEFIEVCAPCQYYNFRNTYSKELFRRFKAKYSGPPVFEDGGIGRTSYVLVTTHIPSQDLGLNNGYRIYVPHGTGFGNDYSLKCYQDSNIYCGHTPDEKTFVRERLGSDLNQSASFIATGCPKNDMFEPYILASKEEKLILKSEAKLSMRIPEDRNVIFIGSHWTKSGLLRKFGTGLIQALSCLGDNFKIIQGSHPNLWNQHLNANQHVNPQTSRWIYDALCRERDRGAVFLNLGVSDVNALLASDIVISDFSSITLEASLLEKRLFLHVAHPPHPWDEYNQIYKGVGTHFLGADDLMQKIIDGGGYPEEREDMIEKNRRLNGYNLGRASADVSEIILNSFRSI